MLTTLSRQARVNHTRPTLGEGRAWGHCIHECILSYVSPLTKCGVLLYVGRKVEAEGTLDPPPHGGHLHKNPKTKTRKCFDRIPSPSDLLRNHQRTTNTPQEDTYACELSKEGGGQATHLAVMMAVCPPSSPRAVYLTVHPTPTPTMPAYNPATSTHCYM